MCFISEEDQPDLSRLLGTDVAAQKRSAALFLLKLKEICRLSQAAINDVVHEWGGIFSHTVQLMNSRIREVLSSSGIDLNSINGLNEVFVDVPNPFMGLETRYLQEKYYLEELGLVVSLCGFGVCNCVKMKFSKSVYA